MGKLFLAAKKVAQEQNLAEGYRVVINNGKHGCQSVHHIHLDVLGGRQLKWPPSDDEGDSTLPKEIERNSPKNLENGNSIEVNTKEDVPETSGLPDESDEKEEESGANSDGNVDSGPRKKSQKRRIVSSDEENSGGEDPVGSGESDESDDEESELASDEVS